MQILKFLSVFLLVVGLNANGMADGKENESGDWVNKVWQANEVPTKIQASFQKSGLNSIADWSGCNNPTSAGNSDNSIETTFKDGWSHFVFIVCIDKMFIAPDFLLQTDIAEAKIGALNAQIQRLARKYPDKVFVISLKSREPIGGWDKKGIRTTIVYDAYEKNVVVREEYIKLWQMIAQKTRDIPVDNLVFNLMNEPEFHNVKRNRRDIWAEYSTEIISKIREISPKRTIILEGVMKSLLGRKDTPAKLVPILNHKNLVYGFHFYEPKDFVAQSKPGGKKFTSSIERKIRKSMEGMQKFSQSNQVPVILSEIGAWGPYPVTGKLESGVSFEDRAKFMKVIAEETLDKGIGITYWALFDQNTPYKRAHSGKLQTEMEKDPLLWQALNLDPD